MLLKINDIINYSTVQFYFNDRKLQNKKFWTVPNGVMLITSG